MSICYKSPIYHSKRTVYFFTMPYCLFFHRHSPHLNIIETLWRKVKYDWLKPGDYASWETLQKALEKILTSVGKELKIDFGELKHFKKYKENKAAIIYG